MASSAVGGAPLQDEFTAHAVRGDAFQLVRGGKAMLVDGGTNAAVLAQCIPSNRVFDHVVCTHNDSDHANGLRALLKQKAAQAREIWLPYEWAIALNLAERLGVANRRPRKTSRGDEGKDDLYRTLGTVRFSGGTALAHLNRIRGLEQAARKAGVAIRWFEFCGPSCPNGGECNVLIPLNSREVTDNGTSIEDATRCCCSKSHGIACLLFLLWLTTDNRRSLVFYAPETESSPGVLFSADGPLDVFPIPRIPNRRIVVTAPHHGSKDLENEAAYLSFDARWSGGASRDDIWVKGFFSRVAGPAKGLQARTTRLCTGCRWATPGRALAPVRLNAVSSNWAPSVPLGSHC